MEKTIKQSLFGAVIRAPIVEELVFSFLPYEFFYLPTGMFWEIGLVRSIFFALIHWKFGLSFMVYAFVFGFFAWFLMVNYGLIFAILAHCMLNIIDWKIGIRRILTRGKYTL